jgi:hypothetical protein
MRPVCFWPSATHSLKNQCPKRTLYFWSPCWPLMTDFIVVQFFGQKGSNYILVKSYHNTTMSTHLYPITVIAHNILHWQNFFLIYFCKMYWLPLHIAECRWTSTQQNTSSPIPADLEGSRNPFSLKHREIQWICQELSSETFCEMRTPRHLVPNYLSTSNSHPEK